MEPAPIRPRRSRAEPRFVLGVAIGAIPLVIWLVIVGRALGRQNPPASDPYANLNFLLTGLMWSGVVYMVTWIVAVSLLASERTSLVGLGMITALIASLVIAYVACSVMPNLFQ